MLFKFVLDPLLKIRGVIDLCSNARVTKESNQIFSDNSVVYSYYINQHNVKLNTHKVFQIPSVPQDLKRNIIYKTKHKYFQSTGILIHYMKVLL